MKKKTKKPTKKQMSLSTGSTLLNLACSDRPEGAYLPGHYYFFVGDSQSGKTWLGLSCFAEACKNPLFGNYRLIYDNGEDGALMDMGRFFGEKVAEKLEPPAMKDGEPVFSSTVEDFYFNLDTALDQGPCIYVLDSMDSLQTNDDQEKFEEQKKAWEEGKETSGTYGMSKAKLNSTRLREALRKVRETESILIIISQTRDNVGFGFEKKTRAGGHALRFYATLEIWTAIAGKLHKTVRKKKRQIGIESEVRVKKNRLTGKDRQVSIPIFHSYGVDDIGSCIDYLVEEGHWKKSGTKIVADDLEFTGLRERLVEKIEGEDLEDDLREIVGDVWREIEEACALKRKRRYE